MFKIVMIIGALVAMAYYLPAAQIAGIFVQITNFFTQTMGQLLSLVTQIQHLIGKA